MEGWTQENDVILDTPTSVSARSPAAAVHEPVEDASPSRWSFATTLHDPSGDPNEKEQIDEALPTATERVPTSDEEDRRPMLERMLARLPPSAWSTRRREHGSDSRDNGGEGHVVDGGLSRTTTSASQMTTYSSNASTLPPPYVEYD